MLNAFQRLWNFIEPKRQYQLGAMLLLMLLASVAEMFSIGAVIPFLAVMANPTQALDQPSMRHLAQWLGAADPSALLAAIAISFGVAALFAAAVRVLLLYTSTRLSFSIGANLSSRIYLYTLHQPYIRHLNRNTSEVIAGITSKSNNVISGALLPALTIASSLMLMSTIVGMLMWINPAVTFGAVGVFGLIYVAMTLLMKRQLARNGQRISDESVQVLRCLQEGLGGIREVLLEGNQSLYCDEYRKADRILRDAQGSNVFISQFPRYAIEGLGLFMIAMFAFAQAGRVGGVDSMLPTLGALALGAGRLLPVLQHAYGSWAAIQGSMAELEDVLSLLEEDRLNPATVPREALPFAERIELNMIDFRYADKPILHGVTATIRKGDCIGIVGRSGSGKSTLVDLLMGLLVPDHGSIAIDGVMLTETNLRAWQERIAHVPQSIFLVDGSVADNLIFGMSGTPPSARELYDIVVAVGLGNLVQSPDDLYRLGVGERGARISGGQRQRIAIARALVRKADIIVFDEATSALDEQTEAEIVAMLQHLDKRKTIIMISHRMATLKHCNRLFAIADGRLQEQPVLP
jgi:ATP-binding cassette, subfamily B, bacterial PglK